MTDKEYQDKKRECWIECAFGDCNLGDASTPVTVIDTCKQVFDWAFDRAYALGKQTETITQEEIEKAAEKYDSEHAYYNSNDVIECFVEGANFALGKQEKDADTVIQGWIFVDETTFGRILCVRRVTQGEYEAVWDSGHPEFCLGEELFPDMVPGKLPEPVEIIIKRK